MPLADFCEAVWIICGLNFRIWFYIVGVGRLIIILF